MEIGDLRVTDVDKDPDLLNPVPRLTDLIAKLQYLIDSDYCALPGGHFTFPDGETWWKSEATSGEEAKWMAWRTEDDYISAACADGMCPLCLVQARQRDREEIERLKVELHKGDAALKAYCGRELAALRAALGFERNWNEAQGIMASDYRRGVVEGAREMRERAAQWLEKNGRELAAQDIRLLPDKPSDFRPLGGQEAGEYSTSQVAVSFEEHSQ